jgi:hypothetical protein
MLRGMMFAVCEIESSHREIFIIYAYSSRKIAAAVFRKTFSEKTFFLETHFAECVVHAWKHVSYVNDKHLKRQRQSDLSHAGY